LRRNWRGKSLGAHWWRGERHPFEYHNALLVSASYSATARRNNWLMHNKHLFLPLFFPDESLYNLFLQGCISGKSGVDPKRWHRERRSLPLFQNEMKQMKCSNGYTEVKVNESFPGKASVEDMKSGRLGIRTPDLLRVKQPL
jgi:hypothetical protein